MLFSFGDRASARRPKSLALGTHPLYRARHTARAAGVFQARRVVSGLRFQGETAIASLHECGYLF